MKTNSILMFACLISINLAYAGPESIKSIRKDLKALADRQQEHLVSERLTSLYSYADIVEATSLELNNLQLDGGYVGCDSVWQLLAGLYNGGEQEVVSQAHADMLVEGLVFGNTETIIMVCQRLSRIPADLRQDASVVMNGMVQVESDPHLLSAILLYMSTTGELDDQNFNYIEGFQAGFGEANQQLKNNIELDDYAATIFSRKEGRLRLGAVTSCAASSGEGLLSDMLAYLSALPDEYIYVSDAMAILGVGARLQEASISDKSAWLSEYARRICLVSGKDHKRRRSVRYIYHVARENPEMLIIINNLINNFSSGCFEAEEISFLNDLMSSIQP